MYNAQLGELPAQICHQYRTNHILRGEVACVHQIDFLRIKKIVIFQIGRNKGIASVGNSLGDIAAAGTTTHRHTVNGLTVIDIAQTITSQRFYHQSGELAKGQLGF